MTDQQMPMSQSPFTTWDQVPRKVQATVEQLAKRGQFHPDRQLAQLAYAWAVPVARERSWILWPVFAAVAIFAPPGSDGGDIQGEWQKYRRARKIVALGNPNAV